MFIRARTFAQLSSEAAGARSARLESLRLQALVASERKETRRLTNVIIHLKEQGLVLPPGAGDEVWGRYVMGEEAETEERSHEGPSAEQREESMSEAEFHADLEAALEAELDH